MIPGVFDLKLYRGDTHSWTFNLWEDEAKTIPIDISAPEFTVNCQIRDKPKPLGITLVTLDAYIVMTNIINVVLHSEAWDDESNSWPEKKGFWDLEVVQDVTTELLVTTYVAGKVLITPDITDVEP